MSLKSATENLKRNLRASRKAIIGRGGEVSETAGLKDLPKAIFDIPADASLAFYEDSEVKYRKLVPEKSEEFAMVKKIGGMTYKAKNLIYYPYTETTITKYGITFTDEGNGTIIANGRGTTNVNFTIAYYASKKIFLRSGITYTFSCISNLTESKGYVYLAHFVGDESVKTISLRNESESYTPTADGYASIAIVLLKDVDFANEKILIQLEEGATATAYEPYFSGLRDTKTTELVSYGANLYCGTEITEKTANGFTYKWDEAEGIISINGTATGATEHFTPLKDVLNIEGGKTYTMKNVVIENTSTSNVFFGVCDNRKKYDATNGYSNLTNIANTKVYTFADDVCIDTIHIFIGGAGSVNAKFKVMINYGSTATEYKPFVGTLDTKAIPEAVQALDGYGWGVNAEHNNHIVWRNGRVYFRQMVDRVDMGSLTWMLSAHESMFHTRIAGRKSGGNLLCEKFEPATDSTDFYSRLNTMWCNFSFYADSFNIRTTEYTDIETFTTAMQGVMLYYELAEPIETDITHLFTEDNFLKVEGGGSDVAVNEYEYAVPSEIAYVKQVDESGGGEGDAYELGYQTGYGDGFSEGKTAITSKLTDLEATENGEYTPSGDSTGFKKVTVNVESSSGGENPFQKLIEMRDGSALFRGGKGLTDEGVAAVFEGVDTSCLTTTAQMFSETQSSNLTAVPLFDTSNVTDMNNMFYYCNYLITIPLFDTSNVTNMSSMFSTCANLKEVPLLNTIKVMYMQGMFQRCYRLQTVPLFNTSNVTNMYQMFSNCKALTSIPLFDTSKVTNMNAMLQQCSSMITIPLFDTRNATTMNAMFASCEALTTVPQLDVRNVTSTNTMFNGCKSLTEIWIKNIKANLTVGYGTTYGHLLTVDSLVHLCYELRDTGSIKTLTVGTANLEKLADVYVKPIEITDEMRAEDDLVDEKLPFVRCESTDEGATLISDYILAKNWKLA